MPDPKILLLAALLALTAAFVMFWIAQERARPKPGPLLSGLHTLIGFLTNFFDTLGIGSFATTTTIYRLWRLVPVQQVPGTLNVGDALPTVAQALIYITIVAVGFETLTLLILAAVGGSWIGASIVAGMPKSKIQRGMGIALAVAAVLMVLTALNRMPGGGEALSLTGGKLVLACAITFALGALMTLGIGAYTTHHDHGEPARHEPHRRVPDHDGGMRVPDADGQRAVHPQGQVQPARGRSVWPSAGCRAY